MKQHRASLTQRQHPSLITASTWKLSSCTWQPFEVYPQVMDTWNASIVINNHCQLLGDAQLLWTYPNLYLGQYLACVRLCVVPAWMFAFATGGFGGGAFLLSVLLSVMVKPCSFLSCRLSLGRKCVETCWDLTRGLEPILAFPLLLRATNQSRPVLWFL